MQGGFFRLIGIGDQPGDEIDHEVGHTAMAGRFDLADVLELVVDRLDERTFAEQKLVRQGQETIGHVLAQFGDELQTLGQQRFE